MNYQQFILEALDLHGIEAKIQWNSLQQPWSAQGWAMHLPDFDHRPWLILHFQDRLTSTATGCLELTEIEKHYGSRAHRVAVLCYPYGMHQVYQGPVKILNFASHNWLTIHELLERPQIWHNKFLSVKTQSWQCLNGKTLPHRIEVAKTVQHWPNGTLSLGNRIALPQWSYDTYRGTENYDNFERLLPIYQQSAVNIVTESEYNQRPAVISEKTLYAFWAGQIPLIIGHPGAVQDCKDFGFDMFEDLIDTSYDWLPNDQRIQCALAANRDFVIDPGDLAAVHSRIESNRRHVMHGYLQWIKQTLLRDCESLSIQEL